MNPRLILPCLLAAIGILAGCQEIARPSAIEVKELRCDQYAAPLGVDVAQPRLGWQLQSDVRGTRQIALQILAASTPELLARDQGDLWNSGRVPSNATFGVTYAGEPLASLQKVFWKVRVWTVNGPAEAATAGQSSPWSAPASWTMGVLATPADRSLAADDAPAGWHAQWIGAPVGAELPLPIFRRKFDVRSGLRRATINICGLGHYELTLNGCKVGDALLAPGWSKYDRTCLYDTYDVTPLLRIGANAAGLMLGNGMYNVSAEASGTRYKKFTGTFGSLKVIAQLRLEYADGRAEFVGTDVQWHIRAGPITFSNIYGGEDYDARLESVGWNTPDYDDSRWLAAAAVRGPGGELRGLSVAAPPIRAHEVFASPQITTLRPGVMIYDFGQNASQMPRLRVHGPAGGSVRMIPAELLHADGTLDPASSRNGDAWWQYTLRGDPAGESWFPRFFYNGYRYLQVELRPSATDPAIQPVIDSLESVVVHSDSTPVGEFASSNDLFNRIQTLIRWAQRSNMMSVLTDCPHREKLGWLEQDYLNGPSLRYEFDLGPLMNKALNDMADSQLGNGLVPTIAPEYTIFTDHDTQLGGRGVFGDSPEWGSALVQVAWQQYLWSGDRTVLSRFYGPMKRYTEYLGTRRNDAGLINYGLGDWYDLGPGRPGKAQLTPIALTATAIYYADLKVMAKAAALLGRPDDAKNFAALAVSARADFNRAFFNPEKSIYATGSQTANAMPLVFGLVDPAQAPRLLDALVADVRNRGNALTAGDVGYTYLLRALAAGGRSDVIFDMNNQSDRPGYGYQLAHGATSLTEAWNALDSSSQNHFMLGHIMEWFYRDLAGIGVDPAGPGFARIVIQPSLVGDLTWVKASYNSPRGRIESAWHRDGAKGTFEITIPSNTVATVRLPAAPGSVMESGQPAAGVGSIRYLRMENETAVCEVGGGHYTFTTTLPLRRSRAAASFPTVAVARAGLDGK